MMKQAKANEVLKEMQKRYPNAEVSVQMVEKMGGAKTGLMIKENGSNVAPTIYLDDFKGDDSVEVICDKIQSLYEGGRLDGDIDFKWFTDFDKVKGRLQMKLLNPDHCRKYLEDKPNVPFLDMAVSFYIHIEDEKIGKGVIAITKKHMELWGVNEQDLYDEALKNAQPTIKGMSETLGDMGLPLFGDYGDDFMYIVSNEEKTYGAGQLIAALDTLKERFKTFFILPCSVHEVLCLPCNDPEEGSMLSEMVSQINGEAVAPEDFLSNHAYWFDGEKLNA